MTTTSSETVTRVQALPWQRIDLHLGSPPCPYWYGCECERELVQTIADLDADRYLVVTDDRVLALHGRRIVEALATQAPVEVLSHAPGEGMKSLPVLHSHLERAVAAGATRRSVVVALGGGTVGNLGGMVAGLLYRGVALVHVPTTIMAAADSVISLKQAINSSTGKNHFGLYHRPLAVLADFALFDTLAPAEVRSGICEAIKNCLAIRPHGIAALRGLLHLDLARDPEALQRLLEESIGAKGEVMREDMREQGSGLVLEYGHTLGHAIELCDHRAGGAEAIPHGEAVGIGMVLAARLAARRGWLGAAETALHEELLAAIGAPVRIPARLPTEEILALVARDNKRGYLPGLGTDQVPFVLLRELGRPARTAGLPLAPVAQAEVAAEVAALRER